MIQYDTIWYNMIQYDTNMIQYDSVWYNMIQYDTIWYRYDTVWYRLLYSMYRIQHDTEYWGFEVSNIELF